MQRTRIAALALMGALSLILVAPGSVAADAVATPSVGAITVAAVANQRPVTQNQTVTTARDAPVIVTATATDPDGDALTFYPITFSGCRCGGYNGSISGTLPTVTFTPDPGFTGTAVFWFGANDGELSSSWQGPDTWGVVTVIVTPAAISTPATKKECRHGGWKAYDAFSSEKECRKAVQALKRNRS